MKIAYFILAHKNPRQLIRLVHQLDCVQASFVIHYAANANTAEFHHLVQALKEKPNIFFINRIPCYWGHFSLVQATIECMRFSINRKLDFDYAILLSGQDYPIKSNSEILRTLATHKGKQFLSYHSLPYKGWAKGGMNRLNYPLFQRLFGSSMQKVYGGSQWWCLTTDCILDIHRFIDKHPEFVAFFRSTKIPDEMFFHTIILNSPFRNRIINNNLRHIDWSKRQKPAVLMKKDLPKLKSSSALFARKFDMKKDAKILNLIDQLRRQKFNN